MGGCWWLFVLFLRFDSVLSSQYVLRRLGFDVIECNSRYMVVFVLGSVTHLSCALESCNCAKYSVQ